MKPKIQKNLLYILIPTFILIIVWIVSDIYNHAVMTTITADQAISVQPINDSFNTQVLNSLRGRKTIISDSTAEAVVPSIEPTIFPSPELDIEPAPDSSESVEETP